MKSLLEYKNLIMSTGLIPAIVCMIFCIFFQDAVVLYVCSLASIIYILYRLVKPPVYQPNLVLLHGTLALIIASIIKGISSVAGSSTIKSVSSLLESYDGVCAGFKLSKQ